MTWFQIAINPFWNLKCLYTLDMFCYWYDWSNSLRSESKCFNLPISHKKSVKSLQCNGKYLLKSQCWAHRMSSIGWWQMGLCSNLDKTLKQILRLVHQNMTTSIWQQCKDSQIPSWCFWRIMWIQQLKEEHKTQLTKLKKKKKERKTTTYNLRDLILFGHNPFQALKYFPAIFKSCFFFSCCPFNSW